MRVRVRQHHNGDWYVESRVWQRFWWSDWNYEYSSSSKDDAIERARMIKHPVIEEIK